MDPSPPRVYLDYNATAPLRPAAWEAMAPWTRGTFGNPSSVHAEGRAARGALDRARGQVAKALGGRPAEVVLTASATEANNLALKGVAFEAPTERRRLLVTAAEHPSVLEPAEWLARSLGFELEIIPVDGRGRVEPGVVAERMGDDVWMVSVLAANNETGAVAPVADIADVVRPHGALLHVDAAQALGRIPVDVEAWGVDLLTVSSHKLGGPRGAGALWARPGVEIAPLLHGGHQERNRRAGTEDVAAAAGFGAACAEAVEDLDTEAARMAALRDRLWGGIREAVPSVVRLGDPEQALPNTLNVAFEEADGEALLIGLDLEGVAVSSGSACTAGSLDPSHVLLAMGLDDAVARSAVRFSLGWATTAGEIDRVQGILPGLVERARELAA